MNLEGPKFQRRIEYFICEHCGAEVSGVGFTNHCPVCLWSKHV
ncbi:MAG: RNHCP domain-containing protein, partial [Anaerolineales bacterium]